VQDRDIPCVKPAAAERLLGRLRLPEVFSHDQIAAVDDFAHRPAIRGHVAHLLIDDPLKSAGHVGNPLTRLEPGPLVRTQALGIRGRDVDGVRPVGLGQPLDVQLVN